MARITFHHPHVGIVGIDIRLICALSNLKDVPVTTGAHPHGNPLLRWVFLMTSLTSNSGTFVPLCQKQILRPPNRGGVIKKNMKGNPNG